MSEMTKIESSSFPDCECDLEHSSALNHEINIAKSELNSAQQSFTDHIIESISCLNSLRLKLGQLRKQADAKNSLQENKAGTLNEHNKTELETEELQNKLHDSVFHSSLSIRRSLMKLSNLLAQHHLLNLPYYELKAYSEQIDSHQRGKECGNSRQCSERLSYSEALQNVKRILEDAEGVEQKTLCLINKSRSSKYLVNNSCDIINDEFKCLPNM